MKNVTLIGASGFVGTAILNELLARGHKVTAFVRNPEKISASNPDFNTQHIINNVQYIDRVLHFIYSLPVRQDSCSPGSAAWWCSIAV